MNKKKIFERFSSVELLNSLFPKIKLLFKAQRYIHTVLDDAYARSRMVGILGREGMGKSSAIASYIRGNPNVYYLRIGESYAINNFFNEMLYQVSGIYPNGSDKMFTNMKVLSDFLTRDNSKKMVLVDDSGALKPRALRSFYELRDNTMATTSFVFLGLDYFRDKLLKAKMQGVPGIAEFYRRIENWYQLPGMQKNEIVEYAKLRGFSDEQVVELLEGKIETIAELENEVNSILEDAKVPQQEQAEPGKAAIPKQPAATTTKKQGDEDDGEEYEEDEIEEKKKGKQRASASRARAAKAEKKSMEPATSDVASA